MIWYDELPDFAFAGMKEMFRKLIWQKHYDFVLIAYAYWASLLDVSLPAETVSVLD